MQHITVHYEGATSLEAAATKVKPGGAQIKIGLDGARVFLHGSGPNWCVTGKSSKRRDAHFCSVTLCRRRPIGGKEQTWTRPGRHPPQWIIIRLEIAQPALLTLERQINALT